MVTLTGSCSERELLLHGLADGELDAANALAMEEHLRTCQGCNAAYLEIMRQKELLRSEELRFRAPAGLRSRLMAAIAEEEGASVAGAVKLPPARTPAFASSVPRRFSFGTAGAAFSAMALAASLMLFVSSQNPAEHLDAQLVDAHVRSLLVSHLTDVASSDQHTVKPWFLGKLDFAPPVVDLAQRDFPLIGGRLDYIGNTIVPALVYKRHGHVINLFVWPEGKLKAVPKTLEGYHILSWRHGDFSYAAVSDLNVTELNEFREDLIAALG
jgi:anti-sigma factor RsiW